MKRISCEQSEQTSHQKLSGHVFSLQVGLFVFVWLLGFSIPDGRACGVNSHLWITDTAICQLPEGSVLRGFYENQRRLDLTRLGSSFPDTGYAVSHDYGEVAHWPPFIQAYVEDFHRRHGQVASEWSEEALDEVAFILGVTAHGFEDELFDTQFLRRVEQEGDGGQDVIDPTIDFLLIYEGHTELFPPADFPRQGVTSALRSSGVEVSEEEVELGVMRVRQVALGYTQSPTSLQSIVERNAPLIPWAAQHYLDQSMSGSLTHEPRMVAHLLEATYQRLTGEELGRQPVIAVDPDDAAEIDFAQLASSGEQRWLTLYFSLGVSTESVRQAISLEDDQGHSVDFEWRGTRWGGSGLSRIFQISPTGLRTDQQYLTLKVAEGLDTVSGNLSSEGSEYRFEICHGETCSSDDPPMGRRGGHQQGCWVRQEIIDDEDAFDRDGMLSMDMSVTDQVDDLSVLDFHASSMEAKMDAGLDRSLNGEVDEQVPSSRDGQGCTLLFAPPTQRWVDLLMVMMLLGNILYLRRRYLSIRSSLDLIPSAAPLSYYQRITLRLR